MSDTKQLEQKFKEIFQFLLKSSDNSSKPFDTFQVDHVSLNVSKDRIVSYHVIILTESEFDGTYLDTSISDLTSTRDFFVDFFSENAIDDNGKFFQSTPQELFIGPLVSTMIGDNDNALLKVEWEIFVDKW